jgi:hypothetical protein
VLSLPAHPPPQLRAPAFVPAPPQSAPPSEVPAPNRRATLTIAPRPVELGWSVSVDGARALEAPRRVDLVAGAHTLTFTSRKVATPVVRTFTLQPNDHIIFAETLVEP